MEHEVRQRVMSSAGVRVARWTIPWLVLGVIVFSVLNYMGQFRDAREGRDGLATGTVDATSSANATSTGGAQPPAPIAEKPTVADPGTIAVALVEGILLRKDPSANGEVMDRLANGTEMSVLEQTDSWLKVRDPKGRVGWIRNNENLVAVKKK